MNPFAPDEAREISEIFLVANTPGFLYKKLRESPGVDRVRSAESIDRLATVFTEFANSQEPTFEDVGCAYAVLVALATHDDPEGPKRLLSLDASRLNWGSELVDIGWRNARSTALLYGVSAQPLALRGPSSRSTANSSILGPVAPTRPSTLDGQ